MVQRQQQNQVGQQHAASTPAHVEPLHVQRAVLQPLNAIPGMDQNRAGGGHGAKQASQRVSRAVSGPSAHLTRMPSASAASTQQASPKPNPSARPSLSNPQRGTAGNVRGSQASTASTPSQHVNRTASGSAQHVGPSKGGNQVQRGQSMGTAGAAAAPAQISSAVPNPAASSTRQASSSLSALKQQRQQAHASSRMCSSTRLRSAAPTHASSAAASAPELASGGAQPLTKDASQYDSLLSPPPFMPLQQAASASVRNSTVTTPPMTPARAAAAAAAAAVLATATPPPAQLLGAQQQQMLHYPSQAGEPLAMSTPVRHIISAAFGGFTRGPPANSQQQPAYHAAVAAADAGAGHAGSAFSRATGWVSSIPAAAAVAAPAAQRAASSGSAAPAPAASSAGAAGSASAAAAPAAPAAAPAADGSGIWDQDLGVDVVDEEERKRARRRHRKAVARIVVDHWKWFARERLQALRAGRHYRRQLMTAAFVALQLRVSAACAAWRLATVHATKHAVLRLAAWLKGWRAVTVTRACLRSRGQVLTRITHARALRTVLRAWAKRCRDKAGTRRLKLQAAYFYAFITLTKCTREWRVTAAWSAWKRRLGQRAEAHRRRQMLARGIKALVSRVEGAARKRLQLGRALMHRRRAALTLCIRAWREAMALVRECRAAACALLRQANLNRFVHLMQRALREWKVLTTLKCALAAQGATAAQHLAAWKAQQCLLLWHAWAHRKRTLRLAAGAFVPVGRRWRLGQLLNRWRLVVEVLQGQRGAEIRSIVVQRAALRTLRAYALHRARKAELQLTAHTRVTWLRARAVIAEWRLAAARLAAKKSLMHAAGEWRDRTLTHRAFSAWRYCVAVRAHKGWQGRRADRHRALRLLAASWTAWAAHHARAGRKRAAAQYHRLVLLRRVCTAWLQYSRYKGYREEQRRRAVRFSYLGHLRNGWAALAAALARRRSKCALWARMAAHRGAVLLRTALAVWAREFLPASAAARVASGRAALHWKLRLLRAVMQGWQGEAARLAIKHGKQREADHFASQHRLHAAFNRWWDGLAAQRLSRADKARRLAEVTRVLGCRKAARLLRAWMDVHSDLVMANFQTARARGAWRERMERRALTAWTTHMEHARAKRHAAATAHRHWALRCWGIAWPAWRGYVEGKRRDKHGAATAVEHARRALKQRGFDGLRWYALRRRQKAADMSEALAAYNTRLQREAAAQWLRVGLWRRQLRLKALAQHKAQVLAAELALVEPYARRWRQLVLQRRRERATGAYWLGGAAAAGFPAAAPAAAGAGSSSSSSAAAAAAARGAGAPDAFTRARSTNFSAGPAAASGTFNRAPAASPAAAAADAAAMPSWHAAAYGAGAAAADLKATWDNPSAQQQQHPSTAFGAFASTGPLAAGVPVPAAAAALVVARPAARSSSTPHGNTSAGGGVSRLQADVVVTSRADAGLGRGTAAGVSTAGAGGGSLGGSRTWSLPAPPAASALNVLPRTAGAAAQPAAAASAALHAQQPRRQRPAPRRPDFLTASPSSSALHAPPLTAPAAGLGFQRPSSAYSAPAIPAALPFYGGAAQAGGLATATLDATAAAAAGVQPAAAWEQPNAVVAAGLLSASQQQVLWSSAAGGITSTGMRPISPGVIIHRPRQASDPPPDVLLVSHAGQVQPLSRPPSVGWPGGAAAAAATAAGSSYSRQASEAEQQQVQLHYQQQQQQPYSMGWQQISEQQHAQRQQPANAQQHQQQQQQQLEALSAEVAALESGLALCHRLKTQAEGLKASLESATAQAEAAPGYEMQDVIVDLQQQLLAVQLQLQVEKPKAASAARRIQEIKRALGC